MSLQGQNLRQRIVAVRAAYWNPSKTEPTKKKFTPTPPASPDLLLSLRSEGLYAPLSTHPAWCTR